MRRADTLHKRTPTGPTIRGSESISDSVGHPIVVASRWHPVGLMTLKSLGTDVVLTTARRPMSGSDETRTSRVPTRDVTGLVPTGLRVSAALSWRFIVVIAALYVIVWLAGFLLPPDRADGHRAAARRTDGTRRRPAGQPPVSQRPS